MSREPENEDAIHVPNIRAEYKNARYNQLVDYIKNQESDSYARRVGSSYLHHNSDQMRYKLQGII